LPDSPGRTDGVVADALGVAALAALAVGVALTR